MADRAAQLCSIRKACGGGRADLQGANPACPICLIADLRHDDLRYSREVLRDCGNMSSPTVLFVLERMLADPSHVMKSGDYVIMGALGPGFSSELVLLRGGKG